MNIQRVTNPNQEELRNLFERAFSETLKDETGYFAEHPEMSQNSLEEWFDFTAMMHNLDQGSLIEARDNEKLVGAAFIGKQNQISWPDGHKAELFILGVLPGSEHKGLGSQILQKSEESAQKFGAKSIIINTHSMHPQIHNFYQKNGYKKIGELENYYANGNAVFFLKELK